MPIQGKHLRGVSPLKTFFMKHVYSITWRVLKTLGPKMVLEFVTLHQPSLLIIIVVIGPVGTRQRRTWTSSDSQAKPNTIRSSFSWGFIYHLLGTSLNLKYGVLVLVLGCVSCGVFPWDLKAHGLAVHPLQTHISAAVDLRHQPWFQPHTPRGDRHPEWQENINQWIEIWNVFPTIKWEIRLLQQLCTNARKSCSSGFSIYFKTY